MRTDSNRLLVGGVEGQTEETQRGPDLPARRHLAEVVVALLIVGICLYIFVPVFMGTAESARRTICVTHLRRLAQALEMYQGDYDGHYPASAGWMRALWTYTVLPAGEGAPATEVPGRRVRPRTMTRAGVQLPSGAENFFCPSENELPRRQRAAPGTVLSSYTYRQPIANVVMAFGWDLNGGTGEAAHPGGGNVGYLDGRVAWRPASRWAAADRPQ
jgi:prepilin-type processing-associated H-X9-DG protein